VILSAARAAMLAALLLLLTTGAPLVSAQGSDVIVIGAGAGGLAAALEAALGGARVTVLDMASVFGGHAIVSEGGLSFAGTPLQKTSGVVDAPDQMFDDIVRYGEDANQAWARVFAERGVPEIHDWLVSFGVTFTSLQRLPGNTVPRFHENPRKGFGVVEPLYRKALETGAVTFEWNVRVTRLIVEAGRVVGVEGRHERTGATIVRRAPSVVLATGGFQSNLDLVKANWPREAALPSRILLGAGVNALGSGLALASAAGAGTTRLDHQWNYPRGIIDPRYPDAGRGLNVIFATRFPQVNARAERIWVEKVKDMLAQPEARAVLIFDAAGRADFRVSGTDWADRANVEALLENPLVAQQASSLEELARKVRLPAADLARTVSRWNALVATGEDTELDLFSRAKGTWASPTGVEPRPVVTPPFHAVELWPLTRKSMGGVAIDMEARALDGMGRPIPGLYAVGEVAGFGGLNGQASIEGAFIAPAMLQGRIAGRAVALALGRSPLPRPVDDAPRAVAPGPAAQCAACHDVEAQVATPRKGYWHFERVHRIVKERVIGCVQCHADMSPYRPTAHRIDRVAQIDSCRHCHLPSSQSR
jgi:predicted oxidoreductase